MADSTSTSPSVTLIDYHAPWCGPCRAMEPFLPAVEQEFAGRVKFERVNVDEQPDIANAAGVMSLPTLHIKQGDKIMQTLIGYQSQEELTAKLNQALAS